MRMDKTSSNENEMNSMSNSEDSDHVNHIQSKTENSVSLSSNAEIPVTKDVSSTDKNLGLTHDGLEQNYVNEDAPVNDSIDLNNSASSLKNKTIGVNGDINIKSGDDLVSNSSKNDEAVEESSERDEVSPSCNDELENKNEEMNDDKNGSEDAELSQIDSSSSTLKNITNTSCDSEDYHSATDTNEISTVANQNESTDEMEKVTNDEIDSSAVEDDTVNSKISRTLENDDEIKEVTNDKMDSSAVEDDTVNSNISRTLENDDKNENSANSPELMEVDESPSPAGITESINEKQPELDEVNKNSESTNENVEDQNKNKNLGSTNENVELNNFSVENSNENNALEDENRALSKDNDGTTSMTEKCNEVQIAESSSNDSNNAVDNSVEAFSANKTSVSDDATNDDVNNSNSATNTTLETSDDKQSNSQEGAESKNTEVLHIDENDEDPEEVMDTAACDPFGQVTENTTPETEVMEVDGSDSNKDVQNDEAEVVTDINSAEENSTSSDSTSKPIQEKPPASTDNSTDENCIIPDNVTNEATKTTVEVVKQKFDITPVRLEKLMDPSKLASAQEKNNKIIQDKSNDLSSDSESNNSSVTSRPQRRAAKKAESQIKEIVAQTEDENDGSVEDVEKLSESSLQVCYRCSRLRQCQYVASSGSKTVYVCQESCLSQVDKSDTSSKIMSKPQSSVPQKSSSIPDSIHCLRKCSQCNMHNISDQSLTWEAMDFCNEDCLSAYQIQFGSFCAHCKGTVQHTSMGKYSVRFGLEARQFCSGSCLEEFKKGLKSCSYCQHDITKASDIVSAQIVDKGPVKDFCSKGCVEKYERMSSNSPLPVIQDDCTVCAQMKSVEVQVLIQSRTHSLCSDVCFMTFKFANNISDIEQCHVCKKYYEDGNPDSYFVFHDDTPFNFCSKVCMNVFILFRRKIVPCSWCKVKKYNFDMIKKSAGGVCIMMCSLNCLTLYQVSMNATSTRKIKCDLCSAVNFAQYHLTMSDATIRNFCSYNCVMIFQTQYNKTPLTMHEPNKSNGAPVPMGAPKRAVKYISTANDLQRNSVQKVVSTVANGLLSQPTCTPALKVNSPLPIATAGGPKSASLVTTASTAKPQTVTKYIQQIIVKPPAPKEIANKFTQCCVNTSSKSVSCQPEVSTQETQTDDLSKYPAIIPIPVPVYVPAPMHMFTTPFPVPVPFALPIPVPIFIPTTKNTYKAIAQHMKEIVDKTPSNPFEADLLLMAKMVAGDDKPEESEEVAKNESGEDDELHFADAAPDAESFAESETSTSNNFSDDVLQMAMKMATEQLSNTPTVDLEAELTSNTITPQTQTEDNSAKSEEIDIPVEPRPTRARKRANKSSGDATTRKRGRQQPPAQSENDSQTSTASQSSEVTTSPAVPESERPDVNMCLKFTIGIRAWKQWLLTKNEQLEQAAAAANKKAKTFNLNILKLTTDELNYLLCLFVKEVRKPNGAEYAPDTVYYLCLSIQQYLFENGRIDNIFTDSFYEPFTDALDEVAKKFSEINDATQYIVTRVEEEHLWESKQLGAHSPHVLLATLMFFNTKYFNLATLEEHMQLSFSHIMKHWKRNPNTPVGKPSSPAPNRNVVLRFYPPQAALDAPNSRKKKVYEQHENEVNPLRCPVKLYEFYLSKCPESVKQRNDVFYLQPERSCVPDSPVWYSTMPLQKDLMIKMLHRVKMVKEVNVALLAS